MIRFCCLILLFVVSGLPSMAQVEPEKDSRLEKVIQLEPRQMPLGNLLKEITKQSGVEISMDEREALSGYSVYVSFSDTPLSSVMAAVQSFFSHRDALSQWQRSKTPPYTYHLLLSKQYNKKKLDRAFFAGRIQELQREIWRNRNASQEEIERFKDRPALYYPLKHEKTKGALSLLLHLFGENGFREMLEGKISPVIRVADLEGEDRRFAEEIYRYNVSWQSPERRLPLEEQTIRVAVECDPDTRCAPLLKLLSPIRSASRSAKGSSWSGETYITTTSVEQEAREYIRDFWRLKDDDKEGKEPNAKPLTGLIPPDQPRGSIPDLSFSKTLETAARQQNLSFLAILPEHQKPFMAYTTFKKGATLQNLLHDWMTQDPPLLSKWRNEVLLLCPPQWFTGTLLPTVAPLETLEAFTRLQNQHPEKIVPFPRLISLIKNLTPEAMQKTSGHVDNIEISIMEVAARWYPFVQWLSRHPEAVEPLSRQQDVAVSPVLRQVLNALEQKHKEDVYLTNTTEPQRAEYIRLEEMWQPLSYKRITISPEVPTDVLRLRVIRLIVLNRDKHPIRGYESHYMGLSEKFRKEIETEEQKVGTKSAKP